MTVEEIKAANVSPTPEERSEIRAQLYVWSDDAWDRQMNYYGAAGKFDAQNRDADMANAAGKTIPLTDALREP